MWLFTLGKSADDHKDLVDEDREYSDLLFMRYRIHASNPEF